MTPWVIPLVTRLVIPWVMPSVTPSLKRAGYDGLGLGWMGYRWPSRGFEGRPWDIP
jgi:hypothetical protein